MFDTRIPIENEILVRFITFKLDYAASFRTQAENLVLLAITNSSSDVEVMAMKACSYSSLEEVFIFIETNCEKVKEISDIEIVSDGTKVSGELGVEIQHVFQICRLATTLLNTAVKHFNLIGENFYLFLGPNHKTIAPDIEFLKSTSMNKITQKYA